MSASRSEILAVRFINQETNNLSHIVVDDPRDAGGKTMYSISSRFNPLLKEKIENETLTYEEAVDYLARKYSHLAITDLEESLNYFIYSLVVSGQMQYVGCALQVALNITVDAKLKIDGIVGPETLKELIKLSSRDLARVLGILLNLMPYLFASAPAPYIDGYITRNTYNLIRALNNTI